VTGASSGIGEAFADELASSNVDVILVGRNLDALEAVAGRARSRMVNAQVVCADLSTDKGISRVESVIDASGAVDLLVNCAGLGQWGSFADLPLHGAVATVQVNNLALVRLTDAALTRMLKNGRGTIIQISSMASMAPGPQQAVYAATKAFVSSFGQALTAELDTTPVTCTTVLPGFTRTNYFARVGLSPQVPESHWMTSQQVASMSLAAAAQGHPLVIPGARNRWKLAIATPFPSLTKGRAVAQARRMRNRVRRTEG
jgi:short-subunit dehydrogenase